MTNKRQIQKTKRNWVTRSEAIVILQWRRGGWLKMDWHGGLSGVRCLDECLNDSLCEVLHTVTAKSVDCTLSAQFVSSVTRSYKCYKCYKELPGCRCSAGFCLWNVAALSSPQLKLFFFFLLQSLRLVEAGVWLWCDGRVAVINCRYFLLFLLLQT